MVDLEYLKDLHWNWDDFTPVPEKHTEKGTEYFVNSLRFPPLGDIYSKNSIYIADPTRFVIYTKTEILDYSDEWLANLNTRLKNRYDGYMVKLKDNEFGIAFYDQNLLLDINNLEVKTEYNINAAQKNIFVTGLVKISTQNGKYYILTAFFLGKNNDGSDFTLSKTLESDRGYTRGKFMLLYNAFKNFATYYIENYNNEINPEALLGNLHAENVKTGKGALRAVGIAIVIFVSLVIVPPLLYIFFN